VSREEAKARLGRARRSWLARWRKEEAIALELVHLPVHCFRVTLEVGGERRDLRVAVDAIDGTVRRLDRQVDLDQSAAAGSTLLAPLLERGEAARRVAEELPFQALGPALRRREGYRVVTTEFTATVGWPFWVEHLRRRRYRDFRALDAASGARAGSRARAALLKAFLAARSDGRAPSPPAGT
jgi:hypothetical protein